MRVRATLARRDPRDNPGEGCGDQPAQDRQCRHRKNLYQIDAQDIARARAQDLERRDEDERELVLLVESSIDVAVRDVGHRVDDVLDAFGSQ